MIHYHPYLVQGSGKGYWTLMDLNSGKKFDPEYRFHGTLAHSQAKQEADRLNASKASADGT
jgi:hypothetical protein